MAGQSGAIANRCGSLVDKVARSMGAWCLVNGESGTARSLVARAIHEISVRHAQPSSGEMQRDPEHARAEFFGYRRVCVIRRDEDPAKASSGGQRRHYLCSTRSATAASMPAAAACDIQERSVAPGRCGGPSAVNGGCCATHKDLSRRGDAGSSGKTCTPAQRDQISVAAAARAMKTSMAIQRARARNESPAMRGVSRRARA